MIQAIRNDDSYSDETYAAGDIYNDEGGGGGVAMTVILHTATMWIVRMIMMG